jgi:hypothetical protein
MTLRRAYGYEDEWSPTWYGTPLTSRREKGGGGEHSGARLSLSPDIVG